MTVQLSTAVRNALLDAIETAIGASPILMMRSGAAPASPSAANTGTVLATVALPADWMAAAAGGVKTKLGTWGDDAADASGTVGHYRIYAADGTTCHLQGTVTATGGGGDMTVDNSNFAAGQKFSIDSYSLTAPNA